MLTIAKMQETHEGSCPTCGCECNKSGWFVCYRSPATGAMKLVGPFETDAQASLWDSKNVPDAVEAWYMLAHNPAGKS